MSFRKRNVGLSQPSQESARHPGAAAAPGASPAAAPAPSLPKGVRPSPADGRPTTSTGTPSLDRLLAGHAGLPLGSSLLLQEGGTTDAAGALLRYYGAEGLCQGHRVHVIGVGGISGGSGQQQQRQQQQQHWARELPGAVGVAREVEDGDGGNVAEGKESGRERMKIAWRYERQGQFDSQAAKDRVSGAISQDKIADVEPEPFCHVFDLTKRLQVPAASHLLNFINLESTSRSGSPFAGIIHKLNAELSSSPQTQLHRIVIPSILSPAVYPPQAAEPRHFLQFLHALRGLLRLHASRLTALISLPLELYPRASSLVRWSEILCDGALELAPFPHQANDGLGQTGAATALEERPQGMFKIHKLPVFHERCGGAGGLKGLSDDFAYTISRRRFAIKPFSLPPAEGDTDAQKGQVDGATAMPSKEKMEF